jgi:hypothetical protein
VNLHAVEKENISRYLALLIEADEPTALLGVLRRICEVKAREGIRKEYSREDINEWYQLADACWKVEQMMGIVTKG